MPRLAFILAVALIASSALAQFGSGESGPIQPGPSSSALPITPKIGALAYDDELNSQAVWFEATAADPTLGPNEVIESRTWGSEPNSLWRSMTVPSTEQGKKTVQIYVTSPGFYAIQCTTIVRNTSTNATKPPINYTSYCAAIGGPLTLGVIRRKIPGTDDEFDTFTHDEDDPKKPFYLQAFGFKRDEGMVYGRQPAQDGKVEALSQPDGTTLAWNIPAPLFSPEVHYAPQGGQPEAITVKAEGHGLNKTISCTFTLTWDEKPNDPTNALIQASTSDNTSTTPHPTELNSMMINQFSGHRPKWFNRYRERLNKDDDSNLPSIPLVDDPIAPHATGGTSCGIQAWLKLLDESNYPMPGVWVQERYPEDHPENFVTNDANGFTWTTMKNPNHMGVIHREDHLAYFWDPPKPSPNWPQIGNSEYYPLFYHSYWAGTNESYGGNKVVGVQVPPGKVYRIIFVPGGVNNSPSAGTVSHWSVVDPEP